MPREEMHFITLVVVPRNVSASLPAAFLYVYNAWLQGAGAVFPHDFSFELIARETTLMPAN